MLKSMQKCKLWPVCSCVLYKNVQIFVQIVQETATNDHSLTVDILINLSLQIVIVMMCGFVSYICVLELVGTVSILESYEESSCRLWPACERTTQQEICTSANYNCACFLLRFLLMLCTVYYSRRCL